MPPHFSSFIPHPSPLIRHSSFVIRHFLPLLFLALLAQTTAPATAPLAQRGEIVGTLKSPTPVTQIWAVERAGADVLKISKGEKDAHVYEGKWDAKTGAFLIPNLLPGKTYDLIVWNGAGRWEGADLAFHRPVTLDQPITDDDKAWLHEFVEKVSAGKDQSFYDHARILWLAADHKHATALVELTRTREFYADKGGEIIYRVELWYFENLFGGWAKDRNTEKTLARLRGKQDAFPQVWQWLPALGGITIPTTTPSSAPAGETTARPTPFQIDLTPAPNPKRGLAGPIER